jgi:hypothetical protein
MKKINSDDLALCRMQADIFEKSTLLDCSSAIFIRRFMNSDVARRMDNEGFLSESHSVEGILSEVEAQYGKSKYGKVRYSADELHWMGYLYRYWSCLYGKSSSQIYKMIGAKELRDLFFAYHSLDPEQAICRIAESKGIALEEDWLTKGVAALKRIHQKQGYEYYHLPL